MLGKCKSERAVVQVSNVAITGRQESKYWSMTKFARMTAMLAPLRMELRYMHVAAGGASPIASCAEMRRQP
jgi:hypothetical protein